MIKEGTQRQGQPPYARTYTNMYTQTLRRHGETVPSRSMKWGLLRAGWGAGTFVYVVKIGVLAHGRQQVQDRGVDSDFVVTIVLPGVVLDHVKKFSNQK